MITLNFEKTSAWVAFIVGILIGILAGFFAQPYVMEALNNSLYSENKALKDKIEQLEQQLSKLTEETTQSVEAGIPTQSVGTRKMLSQQTFNGIEITLSSCEEAEHHSIACQFIINQPHDFIIIYAYGTVLKAQQNVIAHADAVAATEVSTLKTEEGEISSWKLLTPSAVPFTVQFSMPNEVATVADSVELFVKPEQGAATTVKFALVNIEVSG